MHMDCVIAVDLGGTQLRAAVVDRAGQVYDQVRVLTDVQSGPQAVVEQMLDCINRVRPAVPPDARLLGIGLGSPGPLDPETGVVFMAPNMPGWYNLPLRQMMGERAGLHVVLGNDANAGALGEWFFGKGQGHSHLVYITVSTGIGAGVIMDGRLLLGRLGAGTELGLTLVDVNTLTNWETMASGTALGAAAAAAMQSHPITLLHQLSTPQMVTAADVARAAALGDEVARQLMQREAQLLGIGLVNALHLFSPEIILVGGSVVTENPSLLEGARSIVQRYTISDIYRAVPIEVTHLGNQAGVLGAAALMFYHYGGAPGQ